MTAMTTTNGAQVQDKMAIMERVLVAGDLSKLTPAERTYYYNRVCESVGLNPLTRPFAYINLGKGLFLYCLKDATEQLRKKHGVSIRIVSREFTNDCYVVIAGATDASGRADEAIGAVAVGGLKGEALSNALMKAETKAKRRVTLSICGLGWLDESEVDSIAGAVIVQPDEVEAQLVDSVDVIEALKAEIDTAPTMDALKQIVVRVNNDLRLGKLPSSIKTAVNTAYSARKAALGG